MCIVQGGSHMEDLTFVKETMYQILFDHSPLGIVHFDQFGTVLDCNEIVINLLETPREKIIGFSMLQLPNEDIVKAVQLAILGEIAYFEGEYRSSLSNKLLSLKVKCISIQNEERKVIGGLLLVEDLTNQKELQNRMQKMVNYDYLTDLPNRKLFNEHFKQVLTDAKEQEQNVALIFMDLDRFRTINDVLGHEIGDQLLKNIAAHLCSITKTGQNIARFGGDSFTLFIPNIESQEDAGIIANKVLKLFDKPIWVNEHELLLTTSIGISIFPDDGENSSLLLKHADIALSQAKKIGRNNYQFYSASISKDSFDRLMLERNLRKALVNNEFILHYQPQINFTTGQVIGMEALIRWNHDGKMIPPNKFIPLAEETGLIHSIGEWVLRESCKQNKQWQEEGFPPIPIAVNLSIAQLQQQNFVDIVSQTLEETGLDAQYLELELTESMLIQNMEIMMTTLKYLKNLGVHIVIDDFGTGYSSLSYLRKLFIDTLKIDQSFVQDITTHINDALISTAIISLAKSLQIDVIAEGVETEEQVQFLINNKCEKMQGYLFSRPLTANQMKNYFTIGQDIRQWENL